MQPTIHTQRFSDFINRADAEMTALIQQLIERQVYYFNLMLVHLSTSIHGLLCHLALNHLVYVMIKHHSAFKIGEIRELATNQGVAVRV